MCLGPALRFGKCGVICVWILAWSAGFLEICRVYRRKLHSLVFLGGRGWGGDSAFVSEINMLLAGAESCCMFALEKLFGSCQIIFIGIILRNVAWSKSAFSQMKLFQMSTVVWNNRCIDVIWSLWLRTSCQVIKMIQKDACLDVMLHFKGDLMWRCEPN